MCEFVLSPLQLTKMMCVGYDTYHDSRQKGLSAGGFVASLNRTLTRWYSRVSFHQTHQELGSALKTHMAREYTSASVRLRSFRRVFSHLLPTAVVSLMFDERDG